MHCSFWGSSRTKNTPNDKKSLLFKVIISGKVSLFFCWISNFHRKSRKKYPKTHNYFAYWNLSSGTLNIWYWAKSLPDLCHVKIFSFQWRSDKYAFSSGIITMIFFSAMHSGNKFQNLGVQKHTDFSEYETSIIYIVNSRTIIAA